MSTFRTIAAALRVTAAMAVVGLATTQPALAQIVVAQANCDWYANTALQQQKLNVDHKCGFKGESWSFDRPAHVLWCQSVSPDQWRRQAQFRDQELAKCQASIRR